jgi:hypothetical protein
MNVADEVEQLAEALQRRIVLAQAGRVEQRCPLCLIELAFVFDPRRGISTDALYRHVFAVYDEHRCDKLFADDAYERADAESVRMAERAVVLAQRELRGPVRDVPSLYERAERESVRMAECALAWKRKTG